MSKDSDIVSKEIDDEEKKKQEFKDDLRFIVIFLLIFSFFRFFIYDYYIIPSCSMVPTLLIGDMPLTEKWTYGYSKHSIWFSPNLFSGRIFAKRTPKRGEIIVFKSPEGDDRNIIKRVIALPGDKIAVENGIIKVNGQSAVIKFKEKMAYKDVQNGRFYELNLYEETLPLSDAPSHTVAYIESMASSPQNHFAEMTVPEDHYFVMGDDRDLSYDSRCGLGLVPSENLMGRAVRVIYSIDNGVKLWEPWLWLQNIRYSRIFQKII